MTRNENDLLASGFFASLRLCGSKLLSLFSFFFLLPLLLIGAESLIDYKIVKITPDQLPEIVKQNGPLEKLTPKEFSDLIGQLTPPKGHEAPRLMKTKYRARLQTLTVETKGQATPALIGSAEWNIVQKTSALQRLPLGEISVGLGIPRWQDGTLALITGGDQSSLLLDAAGEKSLNVDWSARGVSEASELRWELRLPKSPVSEMELDLPDGWVPYTSQNDLIFTGPFPANDNLKAWKITFGGEVRLELVVRPPNQQKANLFHKLQSTHDVQIDKVISTSVFQIESQPSPVDEFVFTLDRSLEVSQIRTNNLSQWTTTPTDNNKNQIKVKLSEPTRSTVLTFVCAYRGFLGDEWKLLSPNLVGSIATGLELRTVFPEDLIGTDWKFGGYRLVQSSVNASNNWIADFRPAPTQGDLIPLSFRPKSVACVWNCKQETSWFPSDLDRIEASLWVDVIRGSLNKMTLRVPSGTEVEQAEMGSIGITTTQGEGPTRLELNFSRPLNKADKEPIKLRLRLPVPKQTEGRTFPDVEPLGVRERSGSYRILPPVGAVLEARSVLSELPDTQAKSYSFGMAGVTGILDLRPSVGNLRTQAITSLTPERMSTRFTISPQSGKLSELVLVTPSEMKTWSQVGEQTTIPSEILDATRLLSPQPTWASLGLPSRSVQRFRFAKPVEGAVTLTGSGIGPQSQFVTPPTVLGSQMTSEITCPNRYSLEVANTPIQKGISSHLERFVGVPSLVRVVPLETVSRMEILPAQLQTSWGATDRLKSLLKFRVLSESGGTLPISWSEDARITSIKIGERSYTPTKDPLPIPAASEPLSIEIEYDQPSPTGFVFCPLNPELPSILNNTTGIERTWVLASGWTSWINTKWYQPNPLWKNDRFQTFIGQWAVSDTPETWRLLPNASATFWVVNRSQLLALLVCGSILLSLTSLFFKRGTWILFVLSISLLLFSFWTPDILRPSFLLSAIILISACFWLRKQQRFREKIAPLNKVIPVGLLVLVGFCFPIGVSGAPETYTFYEVLDTTTKPPTTYYVPAGFAEKFRTNKNAPQLVGVNYSAKLEANI